MTTTIGGLAITASNELRHHRVFEEQNADGFKNSRQCLLQAFATR